MDPTKLFGTFALPVLQTILMTAFPQMFKPVGPPMQIPPGTYQTIPSDFAANPQRFRETPQTEQKQPGILRRTLTSVGENIAYKVGADSLLSVANQFQERSGRDSKFAETEKKVAERIVGMVRVLENNWQSDEQIISELEEIVGATAAEQKAVTELTRIVRRRLEAQKGKFDERVKYLTEQAQHLATDFEKGLKENRTECENKLNAEKKAHKYQMSLLVVAIMSVIGYARYRNAPQMIWTGDGLLAVDKGKDVFEQVKILHTKGGGVIKPLSLEVVEKAQQELLPTKKIVTPEYLDQMLSLYNERVLKSQETQRIMMRNFAYTFLAGTVIISLGVFLYLGYRTNKESKRLIKELDSYNREERDHAEFRT